MHLYHPLCPASGGSWLSGPFGIRYGCLRLQAIELAVSLLRPVHRPVRGRADRLPAQLASEPARSNGSPLATDCGPPHPIVGAPGVLISGAIENDLPLKGGWHWQSLTYALWESFLCISMCIGLIYAFRRYLNHRGKIAGFLVTNAYTAYIIHAPVITTLAFAVRDITLYPLLKWAVVALMAVPLCFALSSLIRKLPYTDRVL